MQRKFLEDLGIAKEVIDKIMAENGNDIEAEKAKTTAAETERDTLKTDLIERDTQISNLKKVDPEKLQETINTLQADNQKKDAEYQVKLKDLKISNAIKLAIADNAQDVDLVAGLFDTEKLVFDGDKIVGLDEQLKTLKESKSFLFKQEETKTDPKPGFQIGVDGKETKTETKPGSLFDAVAAHYQK